MHIPPPEYMDVQFRGHKGEPVACWVDAARSFIRSLSQVIAVSVGHDHCNDFEARLGDVALFYGRKTGYGGYSPQSVQGARVFIVDLPSLSLSSYVLEEDGNIYAAEPSEGLVPQQEICAESTRESSWPLWVFLSLCVPALCYLATRSLVTNSH